MKRLLAILAILVPVPLAAAQPVPLAGVADEETDIPSGEIKTYFRGNGDVIFVQHRTDRWYRVRLNDGCLSNLLRSDRLVFERKFPGAGIDHFSRVSLPATGISCSIKSIRRSAAPPQIDSDSPVTLD